MRIKSKDIAAQLGVSPATVSLALNNKQGINEQTRQKILDYVRQKEEENLQNHNIDNEPCKGTVLFINYIKNGIIMEREKSGSVFQADFEVAVRRSGYNFSSKIFQEQTQQLDSLLKECRRLDVKGIYIMAAEMKKADIYPFLELHVPIVTGDNLFYEKGIDSFLIDNQEGVCRGVDYLVEKGHSNIVYLAEDIDIFNFVERRTAFVQEMRRKECGDARHRIRHLGSEVDTVYEAMCRYLDEGFQRTTAFILESSVVSLGVSKALLERQVRIPRDISLLGFDALAPFSVPGIQLTLIKGTHTRRHLMGLKHLIRRIEDENEEIMKVYYKTRLLEGNSVFDKKRYIYT